MSRSAAIQNVANTLAQVERATRQNLRAVRTLRDDFKTIGGTPGAGLAAAAYAAELEALAARHRADYLSLHARMETERRVLGLPDANTPPDDDSDDPVIFSGGR